MLNRLQDCSEKSGKFQDLEFVLRKTTNYKFFNVFIHLNSRLESS